jgi:hypothetical protein
LFTVKSSSGIITIDNVPVDSTVRDLKVIVAERLSIEFAFRMNYSRRKLKNTDTLRDLDGAQFTYERCISGTVQSERRILTGVCKFRRHADTNHQAQLEHTTIEAKKTRGRIDKSADKLAEGVKDSEANVIAASAAESKKTRVCAMKAAREAAAQQALTQNAMLGGFARVEQSLSGDLPPRAPDQTRGARIAQLKRVKALRTIGTVTQANELKQLMLEQGIANKQAAADRKAATLAKQEEAACKRRLSDGILPPAKKPFTKKGTSKYEAGFHATKAAGDTPSASSGSAPQVAPVPPSPAQVAPATTPALQVAPVPPPPVQVALADTPALQVAPDDKKGLPSTAPPSSSDSSSDSSDSSDEGEAEAEPAPTTTTPATITTNAERPSDTYSWSSGDTPPHTYKVATFGTDENIEEPGDDGESSGSENDGENSESEIDGENSESVSIIANK